MLYRTAILHPDPDGAVDAAIRISYASFARNLGLGMSEEPQGDVSWDTLKSDRSEVVARYLFGKLD